MGAVTSLVFSARNTDKCLNGHEGIRGAVAAEQLVSAADSVAGSSSSVFKEAIEGTGKILGYADDAVTTVFEKTGQSEVLDNIVKTTGANTKIGALAQKSVNPLLCAAAGVRVLKDDDQYAALIEEVSAMGTMFGVESCMKYFRNSITGSSQATTGLAGKAAKLLGSSSKLSKLTESASSWFKNLKNTSNGSTKQKLVSVGLDLLFVAGSICAYNLGKKLGETISGREEETNNSSNLQAAQTVNTAA